MNSNSEIIFQHIGQSGFFINFKSIKILIDPYLSNSVEELDSPDYKRLIPIPFLPSQLKDINWILITHDHLDHCDPQTLPLLYKHNPNAIFIGPSKVSKLLSSENILLFSEFFDLIISSFLTISIFFISSFNKFMLGIFILKFDNDVDIELKAGISLTIDMARSDKVGNIVSKFRPSNKKTTTTKTIIIKETISKKILGYFNTT